MKQLLSFIVLLLSLCATAQEETDVHAIMNLYSKHTGKVINHVEEFCVEDAPSFFNVFSLGWFAHDLGCNGKDVLVGKKIGAMEKMVAKALKENGWKETSKRNVLAVNWVKEVVLAWKSPMEATNDDFEERYTPVFEAPTCVIDSTANAWTVTMWVAEPQGSLPQNDYFKITVVFDNAGNIIKNEATDHFTVEL